MQYSTVQYSRAIALCMYLSEMGKGMPCSSGSGSGSAVLVAAEEDGRREGASGGGGTDAVVDVESMGQGQGRNHGQHAWGIVGKVGR